MKCYALFMGVAPCVFNQETGEVLDIPMLGWTITATMWIFSFNSWFVGLFNIEYEPSFFFRPIADISESKYKKIEDWNHRKYRKSK